MDTPNTQPIIEIRNVSMCFNLASEKHESLKEYFLAMIQGRLHYDEFYALKNVSLDIMPGDFYGLVGLNGSGKSTLRKTIAGVYKPTRGQVTVRGTIAPLIELGAGFDMDLTARENIYLNGAVLGFDRDYMNEHFESIIEFSELRDFIDVPVKNFSSGMIARLGFSIATEVKADLLVVDEVLAVGDFMFQQKCMKRLEGMLADGSTLLFVSHASDTVRSLCGRAVWLDHGVKRADGPSDEVCTAYEQAMQAGEA